MKKIMWVYCLLAMTISAGAQSQSVVPVSSQEVEFDVDVENCGQVVSEIYGFDNYFMIQDCSLEIPAGDKSLVAAYVGDKMLFPTEYSPGGSGIRVLPPDGRSQKVIIRHYRSGVAGFCFEKYNRKDDCIRSTRARFRETIKIHRELAPGSTPTSFKIRLVFASPNSNPSQTSKQ